MNRLVLAVAQIAVGVFVGSATSDAVHVAVRKIHKVVTDKKKAEA